jgi:excisionase family DNA binding protein
MDKSSKPNLTRDASITLLSKGQVAARLGIAKYTVDRWVRAGQFPKPVFLQVGSHAKWRARDIDAFVEKRSRSRRPRPTLRGALRKFER